MSPSEEDRELEALLGLSRRGRAKLDRLHEILTSGGHYGRGATPATVVYRENKLRLLRLLDENGQPRVGPPVLFVPAPVSRYFIIDLLPGRSFAGHIAAAGFDVYIADFGEPASEDRLLRSRTTWTVSSDDACAKCRPSAANAGSTWSATAWAERCRCSTRRSTPSRSRGSYSLTTTVDGDVQGGIAWVAHKMGLAGESYDNPRLVPAVEVKSWFEMLSPGSNSLMGRVNDLWDRLDDPPERLRDVRTMATWVDDVLPAPGRLLAELYQQFGPGRNKLMAGTATIGDRRADLAAVTMPVMSVSAEKDTIAPPEGVDALRKIVPHAQVIRLPGGHVGIVAGRSAPALWQRVVEFLKA